MKAQRLALVCMLALAGASLAGATRAAEGKLSRGDVEGVVAAMEEAARNGDARTVASYMSEDCVVTTSFPGKDGAKKVTKKDKRQYVADEIAGAGKRSDREYETAKPSVELDATGKLGRASCKVRETYTEAGRRVQVVAYEIATVELRDGAPAVTAMDVDAVAMTIDDRRIF